MADFIILFSATFLAFFAKGVTGFGNSLIMGPLYSFVLPNKTITPADLLYSLPANTFMAWHYRKHIAWRTVLAVTPLILAGILPGAALLKTVNADLLKLIMGISVVAVALELLLRKEESAREPSRAVFWILSLVSGILTGLFGVGALTAAILARTLKERESFASSISFVFMSENIFRLVYYSLIGLFGIDVLLLVLKMLPAVALGMGLGMLAAKKLSRSATRKAVIGVLILSGSVLAVKSVLALL